MSPMALPNGVLTLRAGTACVAAFLTGASPVIADNQNDLIDALRIQDTVTIMRNEGLQYAGVLGDEMLGEGAVAGWAGVVSRIYDVDKMTVIITDELNSALSDQNVTDVTAFFTSDLGREIIDLELAAREAMTDEDVEEAANEAFDAARDASNWQYEQIVELIEDSDLVEFNVMGALNSNLAFYRGLADGDALEISDEEILADVASQQTEIRDESEAWLSAYMLMAYQSLSPEQLARYASLYRSDQGQIVNSAIFQAYDQMYEELSYLLGRAVADQLRGQDL
ncbi:MAG: DUF2059 domain-containing protein [Pseudomonadota bacterium]